MNSEASATLNNKMRYYFHRTCIQELKRLLSQQKLKSRNLWNLWLRHPSMCCFSRHCNLRMQSNHQMKDSGKRRSGQRPPTTHRRLSVFPTEMFKTFMQFYYLWKIDTNWHVQKATRYILNVLCITSIYILCTEITHLSNFSRAFYSLTLRKSP